MLLSEQLSEQSYNNLKLWGKKNVHEVYRCQINKCVKEKGEYVLEIPNIACTREKIWKTHSRIILLGTFSF